MFKNIGTTEIIIIAVVLLVLFGGKKIPELARGLGQSGRELKKAKKELENSLSDINKDDKSAWFTYVSRRADLGEEVKKYYV